jgi:hypothetical protein
MNDDLKALGVELVAAERRLNLAVATGRWRDAAREAETCASLDDQIKAARVVPAKTNIVGRPKVYG